MLQKWVTLLLSGTVCRYFSTKRRYFLKGNVVPRQWRRHHSRLFLSLNTRKQYKIFGFFWTALRVGNFLKTFTVSSFYLNILRSLHWGYLLGEEHYGLIGASGSRFFQNLTLLQTLVNESKGASIQWRHFYLKVQWPHYTLDWHQAAVAEIGEQINFDHLAALSNEWISSTTLWNP